MTDKGPVKIIRAHKKYAPMLAEAGKIAQPSVKPWMGSELVPTTLRNAEHTLDAIEHQRRIGYGIVYLLIWDDQCLGMGLLNYIHPVHLNASLGLWLTPDSRGKGLGITLCKRLIEVAEETLRLHRLEYFTLPDNQPSIKLARALGAQKEGVCKRRILNQDALLFSLVLPAANSQQ
ncbi:GNAT family N-acetyltransferase [Alteromonas gilva]|uniref:GNAT family N-acetyltransferase n=1 Tax=Alteromonas gilva TaxID=2987522 RepID=A0ABT5L136_9ALTE|nr:GNAT family N-acetyltransferase [Alteromonas gilva]MDC8830593.1 GNAT family N-acetyltransferase [Alteromonas gilva]